jgi:hypothetical protein
MVNDMTATFGLFRFHLLKCTPFLTSYWRARLNWQSALSSAQNHDVADAKSFPPRDDSGSSRLVLVGRWRAALVARMLTPAFDVAGVNWKRAQFQAGQSPITAWSGF